MTATDFSRQTSFPFAALWRLALPLLLLLGGCATSNLKMDETYSGKRLPRPDNILVYDFASSPDTVKLNRGVGPEVAKLLEKAKPKTDRETEVGQKVADALAQELVKKYGTGNVDDEE